MKAKRAADVRFITEIVKFNILIDIYLTCKNTHLKRQEDEKSFDTK